MSIEDVSDALAGWSPDVRRLVVVGVGNEISADDGAGPLAVRRLAERAPNFTLVDAGTMPESFVRPIANERPSHVIFIDAAAIPGEPGEIGLVEECIMNDVVATTHHIPLARVIARLKEACGCEVMVIGIKPGTTEMGEPVSTEVSGAVDMVAALLLDFGTSLGADSGPA